MTVTQLPSSEAPRHASAATYQMCTACIMDTTDPEIAFDDRGVCNHCREFGRLQELFSGGPEDRAARLGRKIDEIKAAGRGKDYDCLIGLSGGVDSSYSAYLVSQFGLRALAVHLDNGWNSELAVKNVENIVKRLKFDLHTHVLDWEQFRDLQLSFLYASTSDAEIPTDHAIGAILLRTAAKFRIPYLVSGTNVATEGILPSSWTYGVWDWRYIAGVHRRFGRRSLAGFPHYSLYDYGYYIGVRRIQSVRFLDLVDYDKAAAMRTIEDALAWRYYGGKHYESIYTKFFQGYILPRKFSIDKRRAHLSTLICSGQVDRDAALAEMERPPYPREDQEADRTYVVKKLGITQHEFDRIMALPVRTYRDYPNSEALRRRVVRIAGVAKRLRLIPQRNSL
jgi:N-acetyl sugar amidotransferase